jgi:hypothetical protein
MRRTLANIGDSRKTDGIYRTFNRAKPHTRNYGIKNYGRPGCRYFDTLYKLHGVGPCHSSGD